MYSIDEAVQKIIDLYDIYRCYINDGRWIMREKMLNLLDEINAEEMTDIDKLNAVSRKLTKKLPSVCPQSGEFIAYKVGDISGDDDPYFHPVIIKLRIPADAKRVGLYFKEEYFHKCRCNYAYVEEIKDFKSGEQLDEAHSICSQPTGRVIYKVEKRVEADWFQECPFDICSHGIHFFMTEREARRYYSYEYEY